MFEAYLEAGQLEPDDIPQTKEPVWILGKKYNAKQELEEIRQDIRSRLWFTYRRGFKPIGETCISSDKGWGCMLRCGQMVLGQALINLHLGREWIWTPEKRDEAYLRIIRLFEDRKGAEYSIHQVAQLGGSVGKEVGQWFGPNTVAQVLKKLVKSDTWSSLAIHVSLDNMLVIKDIKQTSYGNTGQWRPLVLILPLRLGLSEMNPIYTQGIRTCFTFRQSLGIIGGKPNHALYFIGCVGDEVIYLDPHTTQQACFVEGKDNESERQADRTYHCQYGSRLPIQNVDPSLAVCFFCPLEDDFDMLCSSIRERLVEQEKQPLFEVFDEAPNSGTCPELLGACVGKDALEDFDQFIDDSDEGFEFL